MSEKFREIEADIIGSVLIYPRSFFEISERITAEHFTTPIFKRAFAVLDGMSKNYQTPTLHGVAAALRTGEPGEQDPFLVLSACVKQVRDHDSAIPLLEYADQMHGAFMHQRATAILEKAVKDMQPHKSGDIIAKTIEELQAVAGLMAGEGIEMIGSVFQRIVQEIENEDRQPGIHCGIPEIVDMTGRWLPGSVILLGADSGAGKTSFFLQMAMHIAQTRAVDMFQLEMDKFIMSMRYLSGRAKVSARKLIENEANVGERRRVREMARELSGANLRLIGEENMRDTSVASIESLIVQRKNTSGLDLVIIDHVKLLDPPNAKYPGPLHEQVYKNVKTLKRIAKKHQVVVVALCQFTKQDRNAEWRSPEPTTDDFYGGAVKEHADIMLALFNRHKHLSEKKRPKDALAHNDLNAAIVQSEGKIEAHKLKDRMGEAHQVKTLRWIPEQGLFSSLEDKQETIAF